MSLRQLACAKTLRSLLVIGAAPCPVSSIEWILQLFPALEVLDMETSAKPSFKVPDGPQPRVCTLAALYSAPPTSDMAWWAGFTELRSLRIRLPDILLLSRRPASGHRPGGVARAAASGFCELVKEEEEEVIDLLDGSSALRELVLDVVLISSSAFERFARERLASSGNPFSRWLGGYPHQLPWPLCSCPTCARPS